MNKVYCVCSHGWPPEAVQEKVECRSNPRVTRVEHRVNVLYDLPSEFLRNKGLVRGAFGRGGFL